MTDIPPTLLVGDLPVVFISYGEPNAEENYQDLVRRANTRRVCRVQNVKGHDAAHKAASAAARKVLPSSTNFVTIDADTVVKTDEFWSYSMKDVQTAARIDITQGVVSFRSVNRVNSLCYGNGGIKIWSHAFANNMRTHEQTDGKVVDFCWDRNYVQMKNVIGETVPNASSMQAFRAGYREGVKLTLADKFDSSSLDLVQHSSDTRHLGKLRLHQWTMLGADVDRGKYCILGALIGIDHAYRTRELAMKALVDYDAMNLVFVAAVNAVLGLEAHASSETLDNAIMNAANRLFSQGLLEGLPLGSKRSALVKQMIEVNIRFGGKLERE